MGVSLLICLQTNLLHYRAKSKYGLDSVLLLVGTYLYFWFLFFFVSFTLIFQSFFKSFLCEYIMDLMATNCINNFSLNIKNFNIFYLVVTILVLSIK